MSAVATAPTTAHATATTAATTAACTPHRAVNKAERMGVRRARVVDVEPSPIKVAGRKHGDRVRLTFARARHCPIVRW